MRKFVDRQEREWEVVIGRASWGAYLLIFSPTDRSGEMREAHLSAGSQGEAFLELDALTDHELAEMLERSTPKSE